MYIVTMKEKLTTDELYALARMKKVEVATLNNLRDCLDATKVRKELIAYEFRHLAKDKAFKKSQIVKGLMKKYSISKSYIEQIIYAKKRGKDRSCVRCGKLITTYQWGRNNGICDSCITKAIKNYEYETDNENDIAQRDEEPTGDEHFNPLS